ncbi:hypothetical protein [Staphylococcus phage vB_StaM_SA1]|nr:hypothetical protein [Staphylococcus phage vB_StaM_SA1]
MADRQRLAFSKEMEKMSDTLEKRGNKISNEIDTLKKGLSQYYQALHKSDEKGKNDNLVLNSIMKNINVLGYYMDNATEVYGVPGGSEDKENMNDKEFKIHMSKVARIVDQGISESKKINNNKPEEHTISSSVIDKYNDKGKLKLLKGRLPKTVDTLSDKDKAFLSDLKSDMSLDSIGFDFDEFKEKIDSQLNAGNDYGSNIKPVWKKDYDVIIIKVYKRYNEILDLVEKEIVLENKKRILQAIKNIK